MKSKKGIKKGVDKVKQVSYVISGYKILLYKT